MTSTIELERWFRQLKEQGFLDVVTFVIRERQQARERELRAMLVAGNVCHDRDQEADFYRHQGRTDELGSLLTEFALLAAPPRSPDPDEQ